MAQQTQHPPKKASARRLISQNRRALHDYTISYRLEAGVVLTGTEVKSCRAGKAHLNDAYVMVREGQAYLMGGHIEEYTYGNRFNHAPARQRTLLLHSKEIHTLAAHLTSKGCSAIPLSLYFNEDGRVKVEIGVGKGRSEYDRRHVIKEKETKREMDREMRKYKR
jgi:SsrA-binding protein